MLNYKKPEDYFIKPELGDFQYLDYPPYWVGFFSQDHHAFAAKDLLSITDEFDVECWRPYGYGLQDPHEAFVKGIKHRVFPSVTRAYPQFGHITWSESLYKALINEIENNYLIINISVGHAWFHIKLMIKLKKYKNRFGLVALHRSGGFRRFSFYQLALWKKAFKWYYLIESHIDLKSLRNSDHYFVGAIPETRYLKDFHPEISSSFLMEGIDFNRYPQLTKAEKKIFREKLGLPTEKNLFIVYGNWISTDYNYGPLIQIYKELLETHEAPGLQMIMIGGFKSQDLYQEAIASGIIMIERCPKELFIQYIAACDFFGQPNFDYGFINYGGFGTAMIEALACGLPVISNNIMHFPGTDEEIKQIGLGMKTPSDLKDALINMNLHYSIYTSTRILALKYYDLNRTRNILVEKYRELSKKYFDI